MDEFGRERELRNSDAAKRRRRQQRNERVQRNMDLAELEGEYAIREQSLWTDDEMTDDYLDQKELKLEQVQSEGIDELMLDVGSDYKTLSNVMSRYEAWKLEFTDDYEKAYGSLSLPGAFEFYIRCDMVSWDPFNVSISFLITAFFMNFYDRVLLILTVWDGMVRYWNSALHQNMKIQIVKCSIRQ